MSLLLLGYTTSKPSVAIPTLDRRVEIDYHVSPIIKDLIPDFIKEDHAKFADFLEAYFEWLEVEGNPGERSFGLADLNDIDTTIDGFIRHFKNQYLQGFPETLATDLDTKTPADKIRLMKRIKEFYRAKGSEKSYRLLMRILHDVSTEFYYPRKDILEISSGKWYEPKTLKVSYGNSENIFTSVGTTIQQKKQGRVVGSAKIESVDNYSENKSNIAELYLSNINGSFYSGEVVNFSVGGDTADFTEAVYPVLTSISAATAGKFFAIGDIITATGTAGSGAKGIVSSVDSSGGILAIVMSDFGVNYTGTAGMTFEAQTFKGTGASFEGVVGTLCEYPGYYLNNDGKLNSNKKIRDNYFYQEFSYQLRAEIGLNQYKQAILDLIHPAGLKLFGALVIAKSHGLTFEYNTSAKAKEISVLGHYTPYRFETTQNLRYNDVGNDVFPFGYNPSYGRASAQFKGYQALKNDVGDVLVLTNTDGTSVSWIQDDNVEPEDSSGVTIGTDNAGGYNGFSATHSLHLAFSAAILDGRLKMILTPKTYTNELEITLTQIEPGANGNSTINPCTRIGVALDDGTYTSTQSTTGSFYGGISLDINLESGGNTNDHTAVNHGTHAVSTARSRIYFGDSYRQYASRTGPAPHSHGVSADTIYGIEGNTYSFIPVTESGGVSGATWDSGVTGPLFEGARLVEGITIGVGGLTYGATAAYEFSATADAGDFVQRGPYWVIFPHPNSRGLYKDEGSSITHGASFASVQINPFLHIDLTNYGIAETTAVVSNTASVSAVSPKGG